MNYEDRRTFERFELEIPLDVSRDDDRLKQQLRTHDVSAEGMGIISEADLTPGQEVNMILCVPQSNKEVSAKGIVVWSRRSAKGYRVGLSLEHTGLMELSAVLRFIRSRR